MSAVVQVPLYGDKRRGLGSAERPVAYAIIDEADSPLILPYRWRLSKKGYPTRWCSDRRTSVRMPREILGLVRGDGILADHINGDTLDNRRCNLRRVTPLGNALNRRGSIYRATGYLPTGGAA